MVLELHHVNIHPLISALSLTVGDNQMACIVGHQRSGKTTLLRAILGFVPVDGGHISIDGELLTPESAPYFRKMTAYVPQHLSLPEQVLIPGLERWEQLSADERYLLLLTNALQAGKPLVIVDEPPQPLAADTAQMVDQLLTEASHRTTILAVNPRINQNQIYL